MNHAIQPTPNRNGNTTPFVRLVGSLDQLRELVVIRVSQSGLQALLSQNELGRRLHSHLPVIQRLAELPDAILHDSADGAEARRRHGVVSVLRQDASVHAESPAMVMGYAVPVSSAALALFIHDTAGDANVFVPDDHLPRVAFSELMLGLIAGVPSVHAVYFNEFKRMIRSDLEAQRLYEAARRYDVQLWVGEEAVDLTSSSGRFRANFEGNQAAAERETIRRRTTGGVLSALHSGGDEGHPAWPYYLQGMPLGYGPLLLPDGTPRTRSGAGNGKWKLIAPAAAEVEAVREMLQLAANGRPWVECAEPLARAKVACRGFEWAGKTYDAMPRDTRRRSVEALISKPEHRHLWLTGRYVRTKEVPIPHDGTFEGFPVTRSHGSYGVVDVDVDFGLPEGGFLDQDTAARLERRLADRASKDGDRAGTCALFAYLRPYRDSPEPDFRWERRLRRLGDYYVVDERSAREAVNARGKHRGWRSDQGRQLLSVRRTDLETAVAHAVRDAIVEVATKKLSVQIREPGPADPEQNLLAQIRGLECQIEKERAEGTTADQVAAAVASAGVSDPAAIARHAAIASGHYQEAERLTIAVNDARAALNEVRARQPEQRSADLSTPAALAGCLIGYAGNDVPLPISQALRGLGLNSLRLDVDPDNTALVRWTLALDLPLTRGGVASIPVSGAIRNRHRDRAVPTSAHQVDAAITECFLRDGVPLDDLQTSFGKTRAGVITSIRNHLSRNGIVSRGMRAAIVDLPSDMTETRLALWSVVSGELACSDHLAALRQHLGRAYTARRRHPNAWVRTDTTLVRTALRAMVEATHRGGSDGVSIDVLARSIGASLTDVSRLCGDRVGSGSTAARFRGVLVRDRLNPTVVRLRECPHADCTAAKGFRWLSHYLPVPETDGYHGLICPSCHRLPDPALAHLYLPPGYLDRWWEGPANAANFDLARGAATHEADADRYRPSSRLPRHNRIYNIPEAATALGITDSALRSWLRDEDDPLPSQRLSGPGGLKYAITEATLEQTRTRQRLRELRSTSPRRAEVDGEFVTLRELSRLTNVPEHYLRHRATAGLLGPIDYKNLTGTGHAHLVVSRSVLHPGTQRGTAHLPAEWVERHRADLLLIGAVVRRTGLTPSRIRAAVTAGQLRSLVTDGGTHRFDIADVDAFAERERSLLTPKAAAARAGVTYDTLRRATQRGELISEHTPGGHARYSVTEIDAWAAAQTVAERQA